MVIPTCRKALGANFLMHAHAALLLKDFQGEGEVGMFVDYATQALELERLGVPLSRCFDGQRWRRQQQ